MGGDGSGRKPDVIKMMRVQEKNTLNIAPDIEIPNYSGLQAVKKTDPALVTAVTSVFARTGAVAAAEGDYTVAQLNATALTAGSVLFSNGTDITQDNANFFWDDANNRLGIGTASPGTALHIVGQEIRLEDNDPTFTLKRTTTNWGGHIDWTKSDNTLGFQVATNTLVSATYLEFNYAGANQMVIGNTGKVGIGTASPGTTLHVDATGGGVVRVTRLGTGAGVFQMEADGTDGTLTSTNKMLFQTNSAVAMTIDTAQKVGIGTTSPQSILHLAGASGSIMFPNVAAPTLGTATGACFVSGGAFFFKGSSGTVTLLAAA